MPNNSTCALTILGESIRESSRLHLILRFSLCPDRIECEQIKSLARNFKVILYFEIIYITQSCNSIKGEGEIEGGRGHTLSTPTLLCMLHHHHDSCSTGATERHARLLDYSISAPSDGYPGEALPYHLPTLLPFSLLLHDGSCLSQPITKRVACIHREHIKSDIQRAHLAKSSEPPIHLEYLVTLFHTEHNRSCMPVL